MSGLLYRPDMDDVRSRLTTWWNGGDIGRPVMQVTCPRGTPLETFEPVPQPPAWVTRYSTTDFDYRVYLSKIETGQACYFGEAVPAVSPDLAPNCLALYLGCQGVEMPGTVWCRPCIDDPDQAEFAHDPDNFYWQFSTRLGREQLRLGEGKFLIQFPDLIEGLDTLEAMRGADALLYDLYDRPDWVHACLRRITDLYFRHYDVLYDMFRDEMGGSVFWAWAPGRMAKFQCDFSAMIGPDMFGEFMVPVLTEMCERVSYCMYHWDGPGAIPHHDHLLSIPGLDMLQWTPGAGQAPAHDPVWWPMYHKTVQAGKKLHVGCGGIENLRRLKREFGPELKQFCIRIGVANPAQAEEALAIVSG